MDKQSNIKFYNNKKYILAIIFLISSFITLYTVSASPNSWNMHHVILAYPFLILALLYSYTLIKNIDFKMTVLFSFLIFQSVLICKFYNLPVSRPYDNNLPYLLNTINTYYDKNAVIIHIDWDSAFIHNTISDNKDHTIYWNKFADLKNSKQFIELAKAVNKNLLFVTFKNSNALETLKATFKNNDQLKLHIVRDPEGALCDYTLGYVKISS